MLPQIESAVQVLQEFLESRRAPVPSHVDRKEVIAHATLAAFAHHWPSRASSEILTLLSRTLEIKEIERSRWMTQRRIALAKLSTQISP